MLDQTFAKLLLLVIISGWRGRPEWRSCPALRSFGKHSICVPPLLAHEPEGLPRAKSNYYHAKTDSFRYKHWLQGWKNRLIIHAFLFFPFTCFPSLFLVLDNSFVVWVCLHLTKLKTFGLIWHNRSKINISHMVFNQRGWIILVMMFWQLFPPLISCH